MGSNPCRKIPLLGVAHPVLGSPFSGTGQVQVDGAPSRPRLWDAFGTVEAKKWSNLPYFCIL